ncbi:MAG: ribosome biogenesis GTP-binding protein YihA/YsxC [Myxococcota bacterium]|nr:ribosome biogenesis GTP-binding protein YihA/YsxC [Myxococcota bacterium]
MQKKWLVGNRVAFLGSFPGALPRTNLPEIAFAGRSNVGKSSAINRLLSTTKVARVSKTPGRTQAVNLFEVEGRLVFSDLPGYGFAKVPESVQIGWKSMVEDYFTNREELRLVVLLLDPRRKPQEMDAELLWGLRQARLPVLVLATKIDKLTRNKARTALREMRKNYGLKPEECLAFSSLKGDGVEEAWTVFERAVQGELSA